METKAATWGDQDAMYRAVVARDRRFDGRFVFGVATTGIYCRPSCPARTPLAANVRYFVVAAAAVAAGFRACKRCRPDSVPGDRQWDHRGDLAARALVLVGSGAVDEGGVSGLAKQLSVSERHLHRTMVEEIGVGPLALARTRRAQLARMLLDQTDLSVTDVAFAAGFASVRQFNDVIRAEFGSTPSDLRRHVVTPDRPADPGPLTLRLAAREPFDGARLAVFLATRAVPGVESAGDVYARALPTPHGDALTAVTIRADSIAVQLTVPELAALRPAVGVLRRIFDLDADAPAIDDSLSDDPALRPLVRTRPGLRVPGAASGFEIVVRAIVGQQISVAGARTLLGRIAERCGTRLTTSAIAGVTLAFPTASAMATADLSGLGLTGRRIETLQHVAREIAEGRLDVEPGGDRSAVRAQLLAMPGIGPWTADYIALRALQDPDAFPESDLVLRRIVAARQLDPDRWKPWRAYGAIHLWTDSAEETK